MPNFSRNGQPSEAPAPVSSSSKPTEQSSSQQKIEKYTITWVDWDGDTLISEKYEKGSWPTYKGLTPTRESENGIDFQFTGWLPEITEVNENRAYVAQYMTINSYEEQTSDKVQVKFLNYDGSILLESEYNLVQLMLIQTLLLHLLLHINNPPLLLNGSIMTVLLFSNPNIE